MEKDCNNQTVVHYEQFLIEMNHRQSVSLLRQSKEKAMSLKNDVLLYFIDLAIAEASDTTARFGESS